MTSKLEEHSGAQAASPPDKPLKKARLAPQRSPVGPRLGMTAPKATRGKKVRKPAQKRVPSQATSKTVMVIDLLKRPGCKR